MYNFTIDYIIQMNAIQAPTHAKKNKTDSFAVEEHTECI